MGSPCCGDPGLLERRPLHEAGVQNVALALQGSWSDGGVQRIPRTHSLPGDAQWTAALSARLVYRDIGLAILKLAQVMQNRY